jgi:Rhodopirellula transposase DDE domain
LTRACQGVLFDTLETVVHLMRKTSTQTGLTVSVQVMNKLYETGRKVAHDFKAHMKIVFDRVLPKWNYRAVPQL